MLQLLRRVSRSFYVSVRLLPEALRRPVAVGYLLARASDTIADAPGGLGSAARSEQLADFRQAVLGGTAFRPALPLQAQVPDEAEQALLHALPQCHEWLSRLPAADQADIRTVLDNITRGQQLDVERFANASAAVPTALASAAELDEYTYLVAGCVGEFWTRLGFRHLPAYAELAEPEMLELGRRYGMALQLVNVLRDAGADLAAGRCYLPADELAAAGLRPESAMAQPAAFVDVCAPWVARAREGLHHGLRYALAVRSRRIRAASALPALLGVRTLDLVQQAGAGALRTRVKVPRAQVRRMLLRIALTAAGRQSLQRQFTIGLAG